MATRITKRIEAESGVAGLYEALAGKLPASDLQSLLLDVFRSRAEAGLREPALLAQAERTAVLSPSAVSARLFNQFDRIAFDAADGFAAVDLSPVNPFGASYTLGGTSQNNVLTALRNAEAVGDSTIAMAFEPARRRRLGQTVRLCSSHRVMRLQPFEGDGFSPHFRLFALVSAGRASASHGFEVEELRQQIAVYLRLLRELGTRGFVLAEPLVELTDFEMIAQAGVTAEEVRESVRAHWLGGSAEFLTKRGIVLPVDAAHPLLEARVIAPLRAEFPEADFRVNQTRLEGFGYYRKFALRLSPRASDGIRYPVADGGFTDWTARLLGNRKERLLISGIGTEFLCKKYRRPNG